MRKLAGGCLLLLLVAGTGRAQTITGQWEGAIQQPGPKPDIIFGLTVSPPDHARLEVLGQRIELTLAAPGPGRIEFRDSEGKVVLEGALQGAAVTGVLHQDAGGDLAFHMEREPDLLPAVSRDERWTQDLDFAQRKLLHLDRSFTAESRRRFQRAMSELRESVPSRNDDEIIVGLAQAVALAHNAHTRLYLLRNRSDLRRYPVRVWWFGDHLHVVRASDEHASIVGCEVAQIAGVIPQDLLARVAPMYSGSPGWARYMSTYTMTSPEVLHGLGVLPDAGNAALRLICQGQRRAVQLAPLPLVRSTRPVESWQDLAPAHAEPATPAHVPLSSTPLYLRHPDANYWFEYLPDQATLYFQFARAAEDPNDPLAGFRERLLHEIESQPVRTLIVDLRFNTGGNLELGRPLMEQLQARAGKLNVYVIEGGATFSAGLYHVVQWKHWGKVRLVGEAPGDKLDFWSEGGNLKLPNSGLTLHFANAEHCYSTAHANDSSCLTSVPVDSVEPDLSAPLSFADYAAGADPALAAIIKRLLAEKP